MRKIWFSREWSVIMCFFLIVASSGLAVADEECRPVMILLITISVQMFVNEIYCYFGKRNKNKCEKMKVE